MKQRREQRIAKALRVKTRGVDRNGNPFTQKIHTIDISRSGARLVSMDCLKSQGEKMQLHVQATSLTNRARWVHAAEPIP